ncbi:DUF2182 domain-containing protein [Naasia sp. SYSU D00948]|uniref:copper chaperone n=1 Tax=Naasia sp. SYSU D00948 TaxID=2817379 RepID=UPI001B30635B|nr:DUF2182 domain-containing protein [Naasia sp. SYSU D00948]
MRTRRLGRGLAAVVRRPPVPALLFVSMNGWAVMVWSTIGAAASHAEFRALPGAVVASSLHPTSHVHGGAATPVAFVMWVAMVLAMSPLLLAREVDRVRLSSLRRRRGSIVTVWLTGYVVIWLLAGAAVVPFVAWLGTDVRLAWGAVALVALWHCSPLRQRFLNACHRAASLRSFGVAAYRDALRDGFATGGACAAVCGPLMVTVLLAADIHLVAMAAATLALTVERYLPARTPRWRLPFVPARASEWPSARARAGLLRARV